MDPRRSSGRAGPRLYRLRIATERPCASSRSIAAKCRHRTAGPAHAGAAVTDHARAAQEIGHAQAAEEAARAAGRAAHGSGPAVKSPSTVGVSLPIMMAPAVVTGARGLRAGARPRPAARGARARPSWRPRPPPGRASRHSTARKPSSRTRRIFPSGRGPPAASCIAAATAADDAPARWRPGRSSPGPSRARPGRAGRPRRNRAGRSRPR